MIRAGKYAGLIGMMGLAFAPAVQSATSRRPHTPIRTLPIIKRVDAQPLLSQVKRLREALDSLGSPLSRKSVAALDRAARETDERHLVKTVQEALDPYCLLGVHIGAKSRVTVSNGPAQPRLVEKGWRVFLVKVYNEPGATKELQASGLNLSPIRPSQHGSVNRAYPLQMFNKQPLTPRLSGLELEYRILQLYSEGAGKREARIAFTLGQESGQRNPHNRARLLFQCAPSSPVTFHVLDENNRPSTATFIVHDSHNRVYPSQSKREAPDLAFQPQVYRADGETISLPSETYTIQYGRGPEYLTQTETVTLDGTPQTLTFHLKRWIDPSLSGWWSGDHHIHAAGCAHYTRPTQGVSPKDMIRHCMGEDLKVGCTLTWGPGFDYQKQFFTGAVDKVSSFPYLLRYDVEVSGFGSHESGHLCLLRLKDQIYPGGTSDTHWPTLGLNTLRWAKKQGAICGPAHSGWGLQVPTKALPNYIVPPFDGIGANEYIVDVTHEIPGPDGALVPAVDFMAMADTPYVWELNMWYHTLNAGFRTRISGETDFPCIYDERVGLGRSYVKLDGPLDFDKWCEGIRNGRSYVSDGRSHLMDFKVGDVAVGEKGSELRLPSAGSVHVTAKVAALLGETPNPALKNLKYDEKPYWHLERARLGDTRKVPVEVIVNGVPVARKTIVADGKAQDMAFDVRIERSSWVALRILPSSHTNPIFVIVGDKPIRASRLSADWCLKGVDRCWASKQKFIRSEELEDAKAAYDHAREVYQKILSESDVDGPTPALGDVNWDGAVDIGDAVTVLRAALGAIHLSPDVTRIADATGDGKLDLEDVKVVLSKAVEN